MTAAEQALGCCFDAAFYHQPPPICEQVLRAIQARRPWGGCTTRYPFPGIEVGRLTALSRVAIERFRESLEPSLRGRREIQSLPQDRSHD